MKQREKTRGLLFIGKTLQALEMQKTSGTRDNVEQTEFFVCSTSSRGEMSFSSGWYEGCSGHT